MAERNRMRTKQYEEKALSYLLAGNERLFKALRNQMRAASVSRRKRTANGISTYFKVPETITPLKGQPLEFHIADVIAEEPSMDIRFDFTLYVKKGIIHNLQSYAYADTWPEGAEQFSFSYLKENPEGSGLLYRSDSRDWKYVTRMIDLSRV